VFTRERLRDYILLNILRAENMVLSLHQRNQTLKRNNYGSQEITQSQP
jgi:hypothetical protein